MTISDYHHIMENDRTCGSSVYFQASSTNAGTKLRAAEHPQRALLKGLLKDLGKGSKRKSVVEERGVQTILSAVLSGVFFLEREGGVEGSRQIRALATRG